MKYNNDICIGIPHTGTFPWQTTMSLIGMILPKGYTAVYHLVGSCLIYDAREKIVEFARSKKCKYILMLDSDMVPPKDMLLKMVKCLDEKEKENVDMVSGTIFKRTPPFQPCFYNKLEYDVENSKPTLESPIEFPDKGYIPLQGVGLAGCLIRTSIFDKIDKARTGKLKDKYFYPLPNLGEDLTFCLIANKFGHILLDLSIDIGHVSAMPITKDHFRSCYEEHKRLHPDKVIFEEGKE